MQAAGQYFLPGSARYVEAALEADGGSLRVCGADGAELDTAPRTQVRATSRLGRLTRKLDFPGGGRFETTEDDAIDAMLQGGVLHRLEKSWRAVLASVVAAAAAVAWFAFYGAPLAADQLARHTPASISIFMTGQALSTLDGRVLLPTKLDASARARAQALFDKVAAREGHPAGAYRLLLRNAPVIGPNAFAFPDGRVVLTDQLALMIAKDAELEGVFAHEMSHVNHAHTLQRVYQASLVPAVVALITGDATQAGHIATLMPGILLQQSYSRAFEQQADDDAARLLLGMNEDPAALAELLERMQKKLCGAADCEPSWLGSHPATAERAAHLRHPTKL